MQYHDLEIQKIMQESDFNFDFDLDSDISVTQCCVPKKYRIFLLRDDFTPTDFIVEVLMIFFDMDMMEATRVIVRMQRKGEALCGIYNESIAESKVEQVNEYARDHAYPLLCVIES